MGRCLRFHTPGALGTSVCQKTTVFPFPHRLSLLEAAREAPRLIRAAEDHLADKQTTTGGCMRTCLAAAAMDLEPAIAANEDDATASQRCARHCCVCSPQVGLADTRDSRRVLQLLVQGLGEPLHRRAPPVVSDSLARPPRRRS